MDHETNASDGMSGENMPNPVDGSTSLEKPGKEIAAESAHPQKDILPGDSSTTKAEKLERHGPPSQSADLEGDNPPAKRARLDLDTAEKAAEPAPAPRQKGVTPIKAEYLIPPSNGRRSQAELHMDDDAAEASGKRSDGRDTNGRGKNNRNDKKNKGGQNKARTFGSSRDLLQLCMSRQRSSEFSPEECTFGDSCKFEHNLRRYLKQGKREDLTTFNGLCPTWNAKGKCGAGWKCRFAGSHSRERTTEDGQKELILVEDPERRAKSGKDDDEEEEGPGVVNIVSNGTKIELRKKKWKTARSDAYIAWLDKRQKDLDKKFHNGRQHSDNEDGITATEPPANGTAADEAVQQNRAQYIEPPFLPSEKRRIYYGPETPILAPLTTQGNLPFRRLAVSLGAQVTWSEMAMGLPLIQGEKSEWALMKAHESETLPPTYTPKRVVAGYDNRKDLKFGAQIAGNKPWLALKTTEILTALCPHLRAIDLNCGCPIDLVYRQGAGSALLDNPGKLEKILRGMNAVSVEVPITVKIRMGTRDNHPT
ncbi:tRNA-dihydrouridine synthase 3, partial [Elasticomyces elasticus]